MPNIESVWLPALLPALGLVALLPALLVALLPALLVALLPALLVALLPALLVALGMAELGIERMDGRRGWKHHR